MHNPKFSRLKFHYSQLLQHERYHQNEDPRYLYNDTRYHEREHS